MPPFEVNFDGLPGPTHHHAGIAFGNLASMKHQNRLSMPKKAVKESIKKMSLLCELGFKQGVLPPHPRPTLDFFRELGFLGSASTVIDKVYKTNPELLSIGYASSFMWVANAATISPKYDTKDSKTHITSANLATNLHRHLEVDFTQTLLKRVFPSKDHFVHHLALKAQDDMADEGAANHSRCSPHYDSSGLEIFVYGRDAFIKKRSTEFPERQTKFASQMVANRHKLDAKKTLFVRQNPKVIDKGVFHNDVICVGNLDVLFLHEDSFFDQKNTLEKLNGLYKANYEKELNIVEIKNDTLSVEQAVDSYLFNAQLIFSKERGHILVAPTSCKRVPGALEAIEHLKRSVLGLQVYYVKLDESLKNGGGPACLRLRVVMDDDDLKAANQGVMVDEILLKKLSVWADKHYRDELLVEDLRDPALISESNYALDELSKILNLGDIYQFQN